MERQNNGQSKKFYQKGFFANGTVIPAPKAIPSVPAVNWALFYQKIVANADQDTK